MGDKQSSIDFRDLRTFKKFAQESDGTFSEPALRWMRFNSAHNGFADAFVVLNRRVLIHVPKFNECLKRSQQRAAA
jgi:hypothetical protein